ncbi:uncharacterized protein [Coffea arabica]|uniref:Uncharacterized protein n=1 Tax=Coffea arabica TaxID=13443 RepID=A0ABM4WBI4_COFAR
MVIFQMIVIVNQHKKHNSEEEKVERKVHCVVQVMSWWESRMAAEVVVNVDGILFGMPLPTMSSFLISFPILWQENSLSTSWMYLVGAERLATSCLLARRSLGCVGSPRVSKFSK